LGGAGTGKTVVAIHRAKYLVEKVFTEEHDKILFTTFTRNLAADIKENLAKICPEKLMRRIEVINLDRWVSSFLKKNDYNYDIDYGERTKPLWEKAITLASSELGLDDTFYREEWERVIQSHAITSFAEYLKAPRVGRGVKLSRQNRKVIWPVFEEYRLLLNENNLREVDDAMRDACALIKEKGNILPYRAVIVDEAQDMGAQAFMLIREIAGEEKKNDLFIVGDAHQRIYRHKVVLGRCGIKITGRSRKLRINYRTTEENRRWAVNLLEGVSFDDLDGGQDDQKGYKSLLHGVAPKVEHLSSFQAEIEFVSEYLKQIGEGNLHEVCLVARTHDLLKQYEGALKAKGFDTYIIRRSEAEDRRKDGIRLATMHRVKGLEFDRVIISGVNDGIVPLIVEWNKSNDKIIQREQEDQEKALLYVAATRAKKEVVVTSFGRASSLLR
jgi:superfamily I DNA/RNA helicase